MARIINPTQDADAYMGVRDVAGISASDMDIDTDPLFLQAEDYVIERIHDAVDRDYVYRPQIIRALQFIAGYFFYKGGGAKRSSSDQEISGTLKSRTRQIGDLSLREDYQSGTSSIHRTTLSGIPPEERADFLKEQGDNILLSLGAPAEPEPDELVVLLTESLLGDSPDSTTFEGGEPDMSTPRQGQPGLPGRDGRDGMDGRDGRDGMDGRDGVTNAYQYNELYDLADAIGNLTGASNDLVINLIPETVAPGGILPDKNFFTSYFGFLEFDNTGNASIGVVAELQFTHKFGTPEVSFVSRSAPYRQRLQGMDEETMPLEGFNSVTRIPTGTYTTRDGTEITVTEEDLAGDITIKLDLLVSIFERTFSTKSDNASHTLSVNGSGKVLFHQFREEGDSDPETIAPLEYGLWDTALNNGVGGRVVGSAGTVAIPELPTTLDFVIGTSSQRPHEHNWFVIVPDGALLNHIYVGNVGSTNYERFDQLFSIHTGHTGAGTLYLSSPLGADGAGSNFNMRVSLLQG